MPATANTLRKDVAATLKRLENKDPGLKKLLNKAHGYAVFPSVGKADAVVGGAYGRGLVFERGKPIGYATIAQLTLGVQIGGDTFNEVIAFESKEPLDRFKRGKIAFAANASAVLVKAGAASSARYEKGVSVFVYAQGGMMLELAIGGQKFKFKPLSEAPDDERDEQGGDEQRSGAKGQRGGSEEGDEEGQDEEGEGAGDELQNLFEEGRGIVGRATDGIKNAGSGVAQLVKDHPVAATMIGLGIAGGIALLATGAIKLPSAGSPSSDEDDQQGERAEDDEEDTSARDQDDRGEEEDEQRDEDEGQDDDTSARGASDEGEEQDDEDDDADEENETSSRRSRQRGRAWSR